MHEQLDTADRVRRTIAPRTARHRKSELGQFMTPSSIARFMASLFPASDIATCRLLDAGAGVGALSCAFLDRWSSGEFGFESVEATAYELDDELRVHLAEHLDGYDRVAAHVLGGDYIEMATSDGAANGSYTHVILNPPYKKINNDSAHRHALRRVGIETVNLYSAFVALAVLQAAPGAQIVAIIPRSFCNGPYYRPFRDLLFEHAAIRHMHLFNSRSKAFRDDAVLQENLIVRLERGAAQGPVTVSTSSDDSFTDLVEQEYEFERIVVPGDSERFLHVPTSAAVSAIEQSVAVRSTLADLGLKVSTGPVVDFRLKDHLRDMPGDDTVPLLYPGHLRIDGTRWPIEGGKKPNAIARNDSTEKWLFPGGHYCVVRRFSAKEERRRVVAGVVEPSVLGDPPVIGLENHLNVFHEDRHGLDEPLARGLALFLNTTAVDDSFRRFNGHTQVNATDLKTMKYPTRAALVKLGEWAMLQDAPLTQDAIDARFAELLL